VVKARLHTSFGSEPAGRRVPTAILEGPEAIAARVARIEALGRAAVLQAPVTGTLVAYVALCAPGGRVVAHLQQTAERTWPPRAGVSARARTGPIDPELAADAQRLLGHLRWFGLAQLQFLRTPGGRPWLIDLNARFYGSMALAAAAGINLPALWAGLAVGRPAPARPFTGRPGERYQWLAGDLQRAFAERRGGILADLAGTARWAVGSAHGVLRADDPRATVRDLSARAANLQRRIGA